MRSSFVSPEPQRILHLEKVKSRLIAEVLKCKKNPVSAIKEYRREKQKIEDERRLDEYRHY